MNTPHGVSHLNFIFWDVIMRLELLGEDNPTPERWNHELNSVLPDACQDSGSVVATLVSQTTPLYVQSLEEYQYAHHYHILINFV